MQGIGWPFVLSCRHSSGKIPPRNIPSVPKSSSTMMTPRLISSALCGAFALYVLSANFCLVDAPFVLGTNFCLVDESTMAAGALKFGLFTSACYETFFVKVKGCPVQCLLVIGDMARSLVVYYYYYRYYCCCYYFFCFCCFIKLPSLIL